jgi:hypothetical protein
VAFVKGQSGNPGGRPKADVQVKDLAREHTVAAIKTLVSALKAKGERTRVAAAEALLDRGWGKAAQSVTVDGNITHELASLSDAELADRIKTELAALSGRGKEAKGEERLH